MTIHLDLATVLLLHQCSFLVGAVCFVYMRIQSRGGEGLGALAAGYFALALASALAGLGEQHLLSVPVWGFGSIVLGMTGYALFWIGIRRLSSSKFRRMDWAALAIPPLAAVVAVATQFHVTSYLRGSVGNAFAFASLMASAVCVLGDGARERLPARIPLAASIGLGGLLALMVVVGLLARDVAPMTPIWAFFLRIMSQFAVALFVVILATERTEAELRRVAETDMLTGIGNRRWFMSRLPRTALKGSALLLMDLDFFKQVNDRFGHDAGDTVLVSFAGAISRTMRAGDSFGRLGGEEFGVYLPKAAPSEALAIAESIRKVVRTLVVECGGEQISLTVSIGVAAVEESQPSLTDLIKTADAALYAAKDSGRDRSVLFEPGIRAAA
ncbi:GGDEF domain-containing protein [Rhizobium grahamii]|uniref:diguanylate cyclase n=1 Tax=Rhizobium grahamii CCGE 502 TaxID=990285 RepID=S3HXH7_9HYPH|nr:GGDEF domain-containing protein [Rhizobium grahamii]EPE97851.1 diguanylate cyclase [Rhizobium grahamii CCGE 502]